MAKDASGKGAGNGEDAYDVVLSQVVDLLEKARRSAARSVNTIMTATYWEIGRRIVEYEQKGSDRAEYGKKGIQRLSSDLTKRFKRGFSRQNLQQMRAFYLNYSKESICQTMSGKLEKANCSHFLEIASQEFFGARSHVFPFPWSHYVKLLAVKNTQARSFYEIEALQNARRRNQRPLCP